MPMKPGKDKSQSDFNKRCVSDMMGDGKRDQEQAVAICLEIWRDEKGGEKPDKSAAEVQRIIKLWCELLKIKQDAPEPEEDEDYDSFMSRCTDALLDEDMDDDDAEDACEMMWENRSAKPREIVQKTHAADVHGHDFILSDESIDRMGDVIMSDGWNLEIVQLESHLSVQSFADASDR